MTKTPEQAKAELARNGVSVAAWATANQFSTSLVWEVLAGRKKGLRGQSHKIAVLLGLKEGEISKAEDLDLRIKPSARRAAQ